MVNNTFKFRAKSYQSDSFNVLVNVNFIIDYKLKCVQPVFIKPLVSQNKVEIQVNFLPKSSINDDEIYIPNWILKYWEIDNELGTKNLEVEIQIANGKYNE